MSRAFDIAGYAAFRLASAVCGMLPEPIARHVGEALGYLSSYVLPTRFARAQRHMRRVLGESADTRRAARRLFASYGRYWTETFWMRPHRAASVLGHTVIEGEEHLLAAKSAGRGIILALPHTGNFEVGSLVAHRLELRGIGVAESLRNEWITRWFVRARGSMGTRIVLTDDPDKRVLIDHLESGGTVGLMADRDFNGMGVTVSFFGESTRLPPGPAALALRTGAALLPVATYFLPGRGHRVVVQPPLALPAEGSRRERIERGTQLLTTELEALIRLEPTQWHILQPNWPGDP